MTPNPPWWTINPFLSDGKEDEARKRDRIDYAFLRRFYYGIDPAKLTLSEFYTLCNGVKWNRNLEKGQHPEGTWLERNSLPGTVTIVKLTE